MKHKMVHSGTLRLITVKWPMYLYSFGKRLAIAVKSWIITLFESTLSYIMVDDIISDNTNIENGEQLSCFHLLESNQCCQ